MKKSLIRIISETCIICSALVIFICLGISVIGAENGMGLYPSAVFALFIISFIVSATNAIYARSKLNPAIKYILHLLITLSSAAVFMKAVNGLEGKTILVATVIIAIIHALIFWFISMIKKSHSKKQDYENVYDKKDGNKGKTK